MEIKVLLEDNNQRNEHGLSLYIEYDNKKILFDTGQSNFFIENARKMAIDLKEIDFIVLSHGHYDHGNGLKYLPHKKLIGHPKVFTKRYREDGTYIGLNISKAEAEKQFDLTLSKTPYFINENICFLGEVKPQKTKYILKDGSTDYIPDDSALAFKTKKGLVIITGCSHAGLMNIMEASKKVFSENRIHAVIGGFHLREINEELDDITNELKAIKEIYTGHCTAEQVINYFNARGLKVKKLETFMTIEV